MTLTKLAEFARDMDARTDGRMWTSDNEESDTRRRRSRERGRNKHSPASPLFSTDTSYIDPPLTPVSSAGYDDSNTPTSWRQSDYNQQGTSPNPRPLRNNNNNRQPGPSPQLFPTNRRATQDNRRVNFQPSPPRNPPAMSQASQEIMEAAMRAMNSGNFCRICFAPAEDHCTTDCPYTAGRGGDKNRQEFIFTRNSNYMKAVELGLLNKSRYPPPPQPVASASPDHQHNDSAIPQQPPPPKN